MSFQCLQIQFLKDINAGNIVCLEDIAKFIMSNGASMKKSNEPRRLFRDGCNQLGIGIGGARKFIKNNSELTLFLILNFHIESIDSFLSYL